MISTVTLNPSIDYLIEVDYFKVGAVNRTTREQMFPGGKGINVSIVLKNLGIDNKALGFVAGFTGQEIGRLVEKHGVCSDFITLEKGLSRINVKLKSEDETEINGNGPAILDQHIQALYSQIDTLQRGDILVLAGSIPSTVPSDIYKCMMTDFKAKGILVIVDATKDLLMNVLECGPFLIKPNHHELGELFGVDITTQDEVVVYAKKLQEKGARNVLVSMAGDGAVLVSETGEVLKHPGLKGEVKNSVGAGDSMVAGFIAGYMQDGSYEQAFKMGVATGSASAFSYNLATQEEVDALLELLI
ncbi:MAG: 1-phosphofructokinase [Niameybacter sp.]|uniref:1-phosphofructokinase n=1 Tax=Niameybacter sp. TaxID=2033640 RepID=UPI002FE6E710